MLKKLAGLLILPIMLMMPAFAQAELVKVEMDKAGTGVFSDASYTVTRGIVDFAGNTVTDNGAAGYTVAGFSAFQVTYSVAGTGGFGGFYDTYKSNSSAIFDGFQFDFTSTGDGKVVVNGSEHLFSAGSNSIVVRDFLNTPAMSSISFAVVQNAGGTFDFGAVSAVPEPTSLLLVGSVLGGVGLIRRRRQTA